MRWETLGMWGLALACAACGESATNKPGGAVAGAAGVGGAVGSGGVQTNAGGAATAGTGGASGGGVSVGMCSGSTNQKGGTRLKSKFWVTAEGDKAWDSLWDSELNQSCEFNPTSDGKVRCVPNNWHYSTEVFSDAACTQALYTKMQIGPCTSADYIMRDSPGGGCGMPGGYSFSKLGAAVAPSSVYQLNGTDCVLGNLLSEPLYQRGQDVPPSTFLEGTQTVFEAATRIRPWGYSAADGTRAVQGWSDTELDESCFFVQSTDSKTRCLPFGASIAGYSDSACGVPIVTATPNCDQKIASFALDSPGYQCAAKPYKVLKRGDAFTGVPYVGTPEGCTTGTATAGTTNYLTTPAAPDLFQAVSDTFDMSDPGRLKPRYYDAGGSAGCWFHDFWDSQLLAPCTFVEATDMEQRCLPSTYLELQYFFTDDKCSVRTALSAVDDCTPTELPSYATGSVPDECARRYEVWQVGQAVPKSTLPPLWTNITGTCIAATPTEEKFLQLTLVDPGQFMAGEMQLE